MRRTSDPRRIEAFLLSQDGVLDASVWLKNDHVRAHVTPVAHSAVCAVALREACVQNLGEAQAPESILVVPAEGETRTTALGSKPSVPHIHLETTADLPENVDVPDILEALVATLSAQESVASASVKACHSLRSNWAMGVGAPAGMAHCTVAILTGRPPETRRAMAEAIFTALKERFAASLEAGEVALSLELREMDAATYLKA